MKSFAIRHIQVSTSTALLITGVISGGVFAYAQESLMQAARGTYIAVEVGLAELSPRGHDGGYAVPASEESSHERDELDPAAQISVEITASPKVLDSGETTVLTVNASTDDGDSLWCEPKSRARECSYSAVATGGEEYHLYWCHDDYYLDSNWNRDARWQGSVPVDTHSIETGPLIASTEHKKTYEFSVRCYADGPGLRRNARTVTSEPVSVIGPPRQQADVNVTLTPDNPHSVLYDWLDSYMAYDRSVDSNSGWAEAFDISVPPNDITKERYEDGDVAVVYEGETATFSWESDKAAECSVRYSVLPVDSPSIDEQFASYRTSEPCTSFSSPKCDLDATSGSVTVGPFDYPLHLRSGTPLANVRYSLSCGGGQIDDSIVTSNSDQVELYVRPYNPPVLTPDKLVVNAGEYVMVDYDINNNPWCEFSTPASLSGFRVTENGLLRQGPLNSGSITFTIDCPGGSDTATIQVREQCLYQGEVVPNGETRTFYNAEAGNCSTSDKELTCDNGVWGTFETSGGTGIELFTPEEEYVHGSCTLPEPDMSLSVRNGRTGEIVQGVRIGEAVLRIQEGDPVYINWSSQNVDSCRIPLTATEAQRLRQSVVRNGQHMLLSLASEFGTGANKNGAYIQMRSDMIPTQGSSRRLAYACRGLEGLGAQSLAASTLLALEDEETLSVTIETEANYEEPELSANPVRVSSNDTSILTYDTKNNPECTLSGPGSPQLNQPVIGTGSVETGAITVQSTFTLTCEGGEDTATVSIQPNLEEQ